MKVSIIIPARNEPYLNQTIDDIFIKASGEIEVIVILDGYWPQKLPTDRKNLIIVHRSESKGMRNALNSAAAIATGRYLMKTDAHCMFAEGFDEILKKDCLGDTIAVPSRYSLDVDKWSVQRDDRPPTEYLYMTYPYIKDDQFGLGMHGRKWIGDTAGVKGWFYLENLRQDIKIDDIMIWQGSCWFMRKSTFNDLDGLDERYSYNMFQEANELALKIWMFGGRLIINKNTWYAHWHKPTGSSSYRLSNRLKKQSEYASTWFWMNNKWPKSCRTMRWYIEKFQPPSWPENWEEHQKQCEEENPEMWGKESFQIIDNNGHNGLGI